MDGYSLTEKMRQARRRFRFTAVEQALFYELVAVCNGDNWRDIFDCSNVELCFALGINEKTLIKARESLINSELIYYQSGKSKRAVSKYSFTKPFKQTTVKITVDTTANSTANKGVNETANSTDLYKHKTETKQSPYNPPRGYEDYDFTFMDMRFAELVAKWLEYKRSKNQKYKSQDSLEVFYKKMIKNSGGRPEVAEQMIEESMANNWAGLFPLKEKKGGINETKPTNRQQDYTLHM